MDHTTIDRGYPVPLTGWVTITAEGRVSIEVDLDVLDGFGEAMDSDRQEASFTAEQVDADAKFVQDRVDAFTRSDGRRAEVEVTPNSLIIDIP